MTSSTEAMISALRKMGYTPAPGQRLLKPVGFSLFTFEFDRMEWTCWFRGINDTILRWGAAQWDPLNSPDPLFWLKYCEAWHSRVDAGDPMSAFELNDPECSVLDSSVFPPRTAQTSGAL